MQDTYVGIVCWFSSKKGYGFISWENKEDLFVHFSDINIEGFKTLNKNQKVQFKVGENKLGIPKAIEVTIIQ